MPRPWCCAATESQEQIALFEWAKIQTSCHPELALLHHIPNGGSRHPAEAAKLKREGVKPGVPDLCLPVARGSYHGLYIELKRRSGARASKAQEEWIVDLQEQGYFAGICRGWEEAAQVIMDYLRIEL